MIIYLKNRTSLEHHSALRRVKIHGGFGGRSKGFPSWGISAIRISRAGEVDECAAHLVTQGESFLCGTRHVRALEDVVEEERDICIVAGMEVPVHRRNLVTREVDVSRSTSVVHTGNSSSAS